MKKTYKKLIVSVLSALFIFNVIMFPVSAAAAVYDISNVSKIVVGSTQLEYKTMYAADFYPAPNATWYTPVGNYSDFEVHFPLPIVVKPGDVVTLNVDVFTGAGFNSNSSIIFPGLAPGTFPYHGSWISAQGESWFRWQETVTFTAAGTVTEVIFIPRGLTNRYFVVNTLNISVADKDYSAEISNSTNDIKNNADKNASEIKDNQDKNTDKTINEDYGYQSPDNSDTDAGIEAGSNLIDSLNDSIDEFNASLSDSVDNLMEGIEPFKKVVHGAFDVFPTPVQILFSFTMVFIVLRKVVGR